MCCFARRKLTSLRISRISWKDSVARFVAPLAVTTFLLQRIAMNTIFCWRRLFRPPGPIQHVDWCIGASTTSCRLPMSWLLWRELPGFRRVLLLKLLVITREDLQQVSRHLETGRQSGESQFSTRTCRAMCSALPECPWEDNEVPPILGRRCEVCRKFQLSRLSPKPWTTDLTLWSNARRLRSTDQ